MKLHLLTALVLSPFPFAQTTIRVPADAPTIQTGIDLAMNGDTVLVAPGTYLEEIDYKGKAITVESEGGATVTTIDGEGEIGQTVVFHNAEGPDSILRGFTVTGGTTFPSLTGSSGFGAGITCMTSSLISATPRIEQCDIVGNHITNFFAGGGVGGNPIIEDCTIRSNFDIYGTSSGGGVWGAPTMRRCTVSDNTSGEGAGMKLLDGALVEDCVVMGNSASDTAKGGGIMAEAGAVVRRTLIVGNSSDAFGSGSQGGGVFGPGRFERCTIVDNFADPDDGNGAPGIGGAFGSELVDCIVYGNQGHQVLAQVSVSFSNVEGGVLPGTGNISTDPLFTDAPGGDYTLTSGSPSIDAGDPGSSQDPDCTRADQGAFSFSQANTQVFNGNGINPACLQSLSLPALGSTWSAQVDSAGTSGATLSAILIYAQLRTPLLLGTGELLVDPTSTLYTSAFQVAGGGPDLFAFSLPVNTAFAGVSGFAQGFVVGTALEPCNGIEIKLGF